MRACWQRFWKIEYPPRKRCDRTRLQCIPYIQDEFKGFRCKCYTDKEIPVGCPLATVRLY
jgi:hypothetical protein